jgi:uncharacterized membrane protein
MVKMKKLILISALLLLLFAVGVHAQAAFDIVESKVNLSGRQGQTLSGSFNVKNTGTTPLSINFTGLTLSKGSDKLSISSLANIANLVAGSTKTATFSVAIPAEKPLGLYTGTITAKNGSLSDTIQISAEVKSKFGGLEIEDLDIIITTIKFEAGRRKVETAADNDVNDGEKLNFVDKKIKPGTEMRFNFNIENTFSDSDGIDLENVFVRVTIEEIDDGEDLEEESEEFDLDTDSSTDVDVFLNIPLSVEEGVYDILIEVEGDDDNGNLHRAQMNLRMDVLEFLH